MTAWARRVALAVVLSLRRQLRSTGPPPGEVRHYVGAHGCYWRELNENERSEMSGTDPRLQRPPRRWMQRRAPRLRW